MKNFNEIIGKLDSEDKAENISAITSINEVVNDEDLLEIYKHLYYLVWRTPGWKNQVALVDHIFESINIDIKKGFFYYVCTQFPTLQTDRKDKFYYLIKKYRSVLTLQEILTAPNEEVRDYLCKFINPTETRGWDDHIFLSFISSCTPWTCQAFENIKIDESVARPYLEKPGLKEHNRDMIYRTFKNKTS